MEDESSYRILSSGRKLEIGLPSTVHRILKSGRCLSNNQSIHKKQRRDSSSDERIDEDENEQQTISSQIQIGERKHRQNEPTKKLLLQAVSDANKSVLMKLNKTSGIVKVMKPDGTTECLTTKTLAKRLKAKEPTWIDPTSLIQKSEPTLTGKMKIQIRNEYCSTNDEKKSNDEHSPTMEFDDDDEDEDEFIVVVNNDYETGGDDTNNIWMLNDYPYDEQGNEFDDGKGNGTLKRKLSDDEMSDENDQQQNSPETNKKLKRCRFWPDCHNGDQCEFVHPTQRCTHFPNCAYGAECLFIHPPCRFGSSCARSDCPYLHSLSTPASSPSSTTGRTTITNRPESSTICKFGVQCMRLNCMYSHPRVPFSTARNYKWVNSKWRAPDDSSILSSTIKNDVHENPFVIDKTSINQNTNSIVDDIEK